MDVRNIVIGKQGGNVQVDVYAGVERSFEVRLAPRPQGLDGTGQQSRNGEPSMKPFWEISEEEKSACLEATSWHPSVTEYFPGGGMSSKFVTRAGMPITMSRVNLVKGLGPVLQIAEGWTVELPDDVHKVLDDRTNSTWPTT